MQLNHKDMEGDTLYLSCNDYKMCCCVMFLSLHAGSQHGAILGGGPHVPRFTGLLLSTKKLMVQYRPHP